MLLFTLLVSIVYRTAG